MKPNVKHLLVTIGTVLGLAGANYVYNHVHAWGGIILGIVILILSINYFVKQLKNL